MGKGQERASQHPVQIVEPTDDEKAAAKAAQTFGRSYAHDSTALGVAAFALVFLIVFAIVVVTLVGGVTRGEFATAVGADSSDVWLARKYQRIHADFEDCMVLAAAQRSKADFLVTSDEVLLRHAPVAALSVEDFLALVGE